TGYGAPPEARVTIRVAALLELARWCRQRVTLTGGTVCGTAPQDQLPPAPTDSHTPGGSAQRSDLPSVGTPAGRPPTAAEQLAGPTPRPAARGATRRGGRP